MRVATLARPARGPSWTLTTFGCGFFSLKTWIALTWSAAVIGLSTATVQRHGVAVLDQRRQVELHLALAHGASPTTFADRGLHRRPAWRCGRDRDRQRERRANAAARQIAAACDCEELLRRSGHPVGHCSMLLHASHATSSERPPHPRSARRSGSACRESAGATRARPSIR